MTEKMMRAITINKYGRTDVLEQIERAVPTPKNDQILVKVKAASINPRDWLLMRGLYPFKKIAEPMPITLGSDMSGTVEAIGSDVRSFKVGDDVFGMQPLSGKFGAFADYIAIKESAVAIKPSKLSHADAAATPCAGMTSLQTIRDLAALRKGETILINGASGGVGSYAVQIAKAYGAHVTAVSSAANAELCKSLGADEVIDYKSEKFETGDNKYDVVYDVIGRSSPKKCRGVLKKGGRYITTIPSPATALAAVFSKVTKHLPFSKKLSTHLILVKPEGKDLAEMADLIISGKMYSLIDARYSLEQATEAFEKSQSWRSRGKLVFEINA
ncbi:MAG: NAD(P)-dependent alcohol dehydrogenase [Kordiimonadaceae bacterium]|nr:NAD(P)-dependent alcohol dehydrogenase [Kordiimonadaceae bacterium]